MRKSILLFVLLTLFGIPYLLAQGGFRITGQILSAEDNLPVIGVSVVEKGTTNGVITDIDGNYSITVSKSPATLQFSYVGMKTVEKLFTAATRYSRYRTRTGKQTQTLSGRRLLRQQGRVQRQTGRRYLHLAENE